MAPPTCRTALNNFLQNRGETAFLRWEEYHSGNRHDGVWTCIAYYREIEYGRGSGPSKDAAKEVASALVLAALME
ncbi:hypothetical protein JAAARDRAFT_30242 [Jaapia argillacea MUCL 33604]|uniref:DRBM domain-containing protein n=1 Tax=Jaapia argillacea MUCL 33604 TaxID=933084 RepID=A0A067Q5L5_9AGAM|nr:hypothetical protein JAAARDRAFT_30242 [Jaapia argillacea MUCL 33604]